MGWIQTELLSQDIKSFACASSDLEGSYQPDQLLLVHNFTLHCYRSLLRPFVSTPPYVSNMEASNQAIALAPLVSNPTLALL